MKYILIIIVSVYVLTFPKFSQSGETGEFFYRELNGKKGWNEEGDEDKDGKYVGEIENGKPNGRLPGKVIRSLTD